MGTSKLTSINTAQPSSQPLSDEQRQREALILKNNRFGLLLWRLSNGGVFVFFVLANWLIRRTQVSWPPEGVARLDITIPAIISVVLLISHFTASQALGAARKGDFAASGAQRNLLLTIGLGIVFIVGLAFSALQVPYSGSYSAIALTMNGFHALHALIGIVLLGFAWRRAQQGRYTAQNYWSLEAGVVFWHFVDFMWLLFFVVIYVI